METMRTLSGWVLFIIMALIAAFFWRQSDIRGRHIEELTTRIVEIDAQIVRLTNDIETLSKTLVKAESRFEEKQIVESDMPKVQGDTVSGNTELPQP
jgi:hypothetical protein